MIVESRSVDQITTRYKQFIMEDLNKNYVNQGICFRKSVFYASLAIHCPRIIVLTNGRLLA